MRFVSMQAYKMFLYSAVGKFIHSTKKVHLVSKLKTVVFRAVKGYKFTNKFSLKYFV